MFEKLRALDPDICLTKVASYYIYFEKNRFEVIKAIEARESYRKINSVIKLEVTRYNFIGFIRCGLGQIFALGKLVKTRDSLLVEILTWLSRLKYY